MKCFKCVSVVLYMITFTNGLNENLYIGELSNKSKIDDNTPKCRYRNYIDLYPPNELWRYLTGGYCYNYTMEGKMIRKLEVDLTIFEELQILYAWDNNTFILFDFTNETYVNLIRPTFKTERFFNQWIECSQLAVNCCTNYLNEHNVFPKTGIESSYAACEFGCKNMSTLPLLDEKHFKVKNATSNFYKHFHRAQEKAFSEYTMKYKETKQPEEYPCPALWDGWDCWPATRAGVTVYRTCLPHHYDEFLCEMQSQKYCSENGIWNDWTNYGTCARAVVLRRRHNFHVLVLIISTVLTFPAIVIFIVCMRNQKNIRIDLNHSLKPPGQTNDVMIGNSAGCRILTFFVSVTTTSIFTCMFIIAFYLHKTIARIFSTDISVYLLYTILIVFSVIPPSIWAIVMASTDQKSCWEVDTEGYQWITDSYKYGTLLINLILLMDIIRVIWLKRLALNSKQTKAAVKATLVLIPLFGLPLLITSQRGLFNHAICLQGDIYYYIAYSTEALQGVVVALLFCYLSAEIHAEIKKSYRKFTIFMNLKYGTNLKVPPHERTTIMTNLRSTGTGHISRDHLEENK